MVMIRIISQFDWKLYVCKERTWSFWCTVISLPFLRVNWADDDAPTHTHTHVMHTFIVNQTNWILWWFWLALRSFWSRGFHLEASYLTNSINVRCSENKSTFSRDAEGNMSLSSLHSLLFFPCSIRTGASNEYWFESIYIQLVFCIKRKVRYERREIIVKSKFILQWNGASRRNSLWYAPTRVSSEWCFVWPKSTIHDSV